MRFEKNWSPGDQTLRHGIMYFHIVIIVAIFEMPRLNVLL